MWRAYLLRMVRRDLDTGAIRLNGCVLDETRTRGLYRYLKEGAAGSFWQIDSWCCFMGVHVDDVLRFAKDALGVSPWAAGHPPAWETEPLSAEAWAEVCDAWPVPEEYGPAQDELDQAA